MVELLKESYLEAVRDGMFLGVSNSHLGGPALMVSRPNLNRSPRSVKEAYDGDLILLEDLRTEKPRKSSLARKISLTHTSWLEFASPRILRVIPNAFLLAEDNLPTVNIYLDLQFSKNKILSTSMYMHGFTFIQMDFVCFVVITVVVD